MTYALIALWYEVIRKSRSLYRQCSHGLEMWGIDPRSSRMRALYQLSYTP